MQELNKMRIRALMGNVIGFGCIGIGFLLCMSNFGFGILLFISGAIITLIVEHALVKPYKKAYKTTICEEVLNQMFDIYEYNPMEGFSKEFVAQTYLIPIGNTYSSDDYIRGNYGGLEFERSDVHMKQVTHSGKTTSTVTYFKGSWTIFTFPKKVSSYLMIREREFLSNGKPGGIFSDAPHTEKVKFEDIEFNEKFDVFSEVEHDAFYVCTPHFMEKIKELESRYEGRLTIGIMNQQVHVLLYNNQNAMEPSLFDEVTEKDYQAVVNEMHMLIEIIDILDLMKED